MVSGTTGLSRRILIGHNTYACFIYAGLLTTAGEALYSGLANRTTPCILHGDLTTSRSHRLPDGYRNPDHLRADYAWSYTGALAVTGIVAESLSQAYGIGTDLADMYSLLDRWRIIDPSDTEPCSN